jgi:riboflavin kinase / FMN adenylyltransferase
VSGAAEASTTVPNMDSAPNLVVVMGVFDGVHRGHQHVLAHARELANENAAHLVAMTFDPHPAQVLAPGRAPALLTTIEHRVRLLQHHGADRVEVVHFDQELSHRSPEEFVDETLMALGRVVAVVVGENFRFGHRALGDVTTLIELGATRGFSAEGLALEGDVDLSWSSTRVRSLLLAGHVDAANDILGRPHRVEGIVGHGDKRGRDLGYPTANLRVPAMSAVPADGVYAGHLVVDPYGRAGSHAAAVSIGTNPQFEGTERRVEAYAIDQDFDIYGQHVAIDFIARLRGQQVFDSVQALQVQMAKDVATATEILSAF